jgi:hypothetical protein
VVSGFGRRISQHVAAHVGFHRAGATRFAVIASSASANAMMLYSGIAHLAFFLSHDRESMRGGDYIATFSSGDLRGTNPVNPADRHIAVMLKAARWRGAPTWPPPVPDLLGGGPFLGHRPLSGIVNLTSCSRILGRSMEHDAFMLPSGRTSPGSKP